MKNLRRKTRSDKFPLTLHPTGQYCKKIKGELYYFGADKKQAEGLSFNDRVDILLEIRLSGVAKRLIWEISE